LVKVPFELWNTGIGTPDDPGDDYRIIPYFLSSAGVGGAQTDPDGLTYQLDPNDHGVSGGNNDPYTPWIYWEIPDNESPGEAGYNEYLAQIDTTIVGASANISFGGGTEVIARTVLVNWNADDVGDGVVEPGTAMVPEQGSIIRLTTTKPNFEGDSLKVYAPTAISKVDLVPSNYYLHQNYPNPFNPTTQIKFGLIKKSKVRLEIFNILGQKVKTIINTSLAAGTHTAFWDGKNEVGKL
ncbi:MAG: T9SS type A sorting domain-containing protein, partial [Gammaproteobacteria bacterium]|nr:T9SS type A sorting domain-containing protein [Gammaproteobacteria bacterium]